MKRGVSGAEGAAGSSRGGTFACPLLSRPPSSSLVGPTGPSPASEGRAPPLVFLRSPTARGAPSPGRRRGPRPFRAPGTRRPRRGAPTRPRGARGGHAPAGRVHGRGAGRGGAGRAAGVARGSVGGTSSTPPSAAGAPAPGRRPRHGRGAATAGRRLEAGHGSGQGRALGGAAVGAAATSQAAAVAGGSAGGSQGGRPTPPAALPNVVGADISPGTRRPSPALTPWPARRSRSAVSPCLSFPSSPGPSSPTPRPRSVGDWNWRGRRNPREEGAGEREERGAPAGPKVRQGAEAVGCHVLASSFVLRRSPIHSRGGRVAAGRTRAVRRRRRRDPLSALSGLGPLFSFRGSACRTQLVHGVRAAKGVFDSRCPS